MSRWESPQRDSHRTDNSDCKVSRKLKWVNPLENGKVTGVIGFAAPGFTPDLG